MSYADDPDRASANGGDQFRKWTCPLCGEDMQSSERVPHLTDHA